ncbi:MAG: GNAT family N-acetyltransferase [Caldilineaceae bacterium]
MDKPAAAAVNKFLRQGEEVTLEEAAPTDVSHLLGVIHSAYAEFWDKLDPPSGAFAETVASIAAKLAKGGAIKAVATGAMIGCVLYEPRAEYLYFGRLAVVPSWRRLGVAQQMIRLVEARAQAYGLARVQIGVRLVLPAHQNYYANLGYQPIEYTCHPGFTTPTSVTMEKRL